MHAHVPRLRYTPHRRALNRDASNSFLQHALGVLQLNVIARSILVLSEKGPFVRIARGSYLNIQVQVSLEAHTNFASVGVRGGQ